MQEAPNVAPTPAARHAARRGFTLIELLVVVAIVGMMVVMALPTMGEAGFDRRVYEDAASIAQLIREARGRAIGRGGAVVVSLSTSGSRGLYRVYEAVTTPPGGTIARQPVSSCRRGTLDLAPTSTTNVLVAEVSLDNGAETQADIVSHLRNIDGAVTNSSFLCFTPLGRTYYVDGATPSFSAPTPMSGAFDIIVRRRGTLTGAGVDKGLRRRVIVPSTGMTRVVSGSKLASDPV